MSNTLFCENCSKSNLFDGTPNIKFSAGYLIPFGDKIDKCPYCGNTSLEKVPISNDDFITIRDVSNCNKDFFNAMVELAKNNPIEYQLKISQFKTQLFQQNAIEKQNQPHCPHCHSTNIKSISVLNRGASIAMWGLFSKKLNKSFECMDCKYTW